MDSVLDIEHLVALRLAKRWDQQQLAHAAGIDKSVISRLERHLQADCRVSVIVALATALDTPIEALIRQEQSPSADFVPDLAATLTRLKRQPTLIQRRAALLLNAFLRGLEPDFEESVQEHDPLL